MIALPHFESYLAQIINEFALPVRSESLLSLVSLLIPGALLILVGDSCAR
jgi:hypothetical protein